MTAADPEAPPYRMLAEGRWPPGRVRCRRTPGRHRLPGHLQPAVDRAWTEATTRPGVHLFDGGMLRLDAWRQGPEGLELDLGLTGYKDFLGSNAANPGWGDEFGPQALSSPLGTSAALGSADGHLVFGVRSAAVALYPGRAHPFGGTMEPGEHPDVFAELARELEEEVGLGPDDLGAVEAVALIEDTWLRQPELVFLAPCRLDLAGLAARLDGAEHRRLWTVRADAAGLDASLDDGQPMTAVTRGVLVAAGRRLVGDAWATGRLAADLARGLRR